MPYTKKQNREIADHVVKAFKNAYEYQNEKALFSKEDCDELVKPFNCGDLNYFITCILNIYLHKKGEEYQTYNDIIGVLENCKMEYYRRKVSKYEDKKIKENGDV